MIIKQCPYATVSDLRAQLTAATERAEQAERLLDENLTLQNEATRCVIERMVQAEKERDEAQAINARASCAYCGTITSKDTQEILQHMTECEHHPARKLLEVATELAEVVVTLGKAVEILRDVQCASVNDEVGVAYLSLETIDAANAFLSDPTARAAGEEWRAMKALLSNVYRYHGGLSV
jgi:hypothetical protein